VTFERDGFAVLKGLVAGPDGLALRSAVDEALARPLPAGCARPHNTLVPLRWNDPVVARLLGSEPLVQRLVHALGADDLRWISGYLSVKGPRSAALWWHQDWWCWEHPVSFRCEAAQVAVLCYLTPTDERRGALRLLPGSHRRSVPLHTLLPEAHSQAADGLDPAHPAMSDQPGQLTFGLGAGDAVVIDYRLLHGTHPNHQPTRRDCLILSFTPSWRRLPTEIRAHLISHPAQPAADERPGDDLAGLLPRFSGQRGDLPLSRDAPPCFAIG
jgi:hypothetical protein